MTLWHRCAFFFTFSVVKIRGFESRLADEFYMGEGEIFCCVGVVPDPPVQDLRLGWM